MRKIENTASGVRFADIPQLPRAHYEIDVGWDYLEDQIARWSRDWSLDLDPDFQRTHVWTREQQRAYVEYVLMGGEVAKSLTFNCPGWDDRGPTVGAMTLVDGKQRLEAVRAFLRDDLPAFRHIRSEYDCLRSTIAGFKFRVCSLSRAEVLRLYLNINAGGTPHTTDEIERVRKMLWAEAGRS